MTTIQPELVEKYQIMLEKDPHSKVFAPLVEAYRQMGLVKEGIRIGRQGVKIHPDFASGRVALGRLLLESNEIEEAKGHLEKASELSPENILAHSLLGEVLLKLKRPKEALQAFKMILLLNPQDQRAQAMVKRLESLTADDYEEDVFHMAKLTHAVESLDHLELEDAEPLKPVAENQGPDLQVLRRQKDLDRFLSLADAFMVRNETERAESVLLDAERAHGPHPEIVKRLKILGQRVDLDSTSNLPARPLPSTGQTLEGQIALLKRLKVKLEAHRRKG